MTSFSRNRQNRATFCSIVFSDQEFCLSSDFVSGEHDGTGGGTILVIPGNEVIFLDFLGAEIAKIWFDFAILYQKNVIT